MFLYRYIRYGEINELTRFAEVSIKLEKYPVVRNTPKGYIIRVGIDEKFVLKKATKKFAYENKIDALLNLVKRSASEIGWINRRMKIAVETHRQAKELYVSIKN